MRPSLITELQEQHRVIERLLHDAKEKGVRGGAGLAAFLKAKTALLAHLKQEDELVYPPLRKAAEKDRRVAWLLEVYGRDMEEISTVARRFFEKYENGGSGYEFARDFGTLLARLRMRITNEEAELFRELQRIAPAMFEPQAPAERERVIGSPALLPAI
jgi:hypothetical protein